MATIEEVNAAALAYRAALENNTAGELAASAAQAAFDSAVALEQSFVDAALAQQAVRLAEQQTILDAAFAARDAAFVVMYAAQNDLVAAVVAYVPPEP